MIIYKKYLIFSTILLSLTILFGCMIYGTPTARKTIEAYYDSLNQDHFVEATDFLYINDPMLKDARIEGYRELNAYYSELEIIPFADILKSNDQINFMDYEGDIPGICERFLVKGIVEYSSGWGAVPSGPFSTSLVLVNLNNKWIIVGEGAPTADGCTRAIEITGIDVTSEDGE